MKLQNAIMDSARTLKDGSVRISLVTREMSPTQMAELFLSINQEIMEIDIPDESSGGKTPSQRLRDRLFVYYKKTHKKTDQFNLWYADTLNAIGDRYLEKIQDE